MILMSPAAKELLDSKEKRISALEATERKLKATITRIVILNIPIEFNVLADALQNLYPDGQFEKTILCCRTLAAKFEKALKGEE